MYTVSHYIRTLLYMFCYFSIQTVMANIVVIDGPWRTFVQPDGTVVEIRQNGDSNNHWFENKNGYVLKLHNNTLYYQLRDSDELVPVSAEVPENAMIASEKWANFKPNETKLPVIKEAEQINRGRSISSRFHVVNVTPAQPLLIIALTFNNSSMAYSKEQHLEKFYGPGSVSEYFLKASFGEFSITRAQEKQGVVNDGYIQVKLNTEQPDRIGRGLIENGADIKDVRIKTLFDSILDTANNYIDFSVYDTNNDGIIDPRELAITTIVSGWEASSNSEKKPATWGHFIGIYSDNTYDGVKIRGISAFGEKNSDTEPFNIYTIAHELGHHILSLPDLYTANGGSSYADWGIMANTPCCDFNIPIDFSGWSKDQVGFLKPKLHTKEEQRITLRPSHKYPEAYKIWIDPYRHNEYLLLEFKVNEGINTALRDWGLVVSHVAEYHSNFNSFKEESTKSVVPIFDNGRPYGHSSNGLANIRNRAGVMTNISITDIKMNGTTSVSALVKAPIADKSSIGHNEAPHLRGAGYTNSYRGSHYGDRAIIMEIANSALYADGIDLAEVQESEVFVNFNSSRVIPEHPFEADVRLATSLQAIQDNNYLYSGQCTINKKDWNRCLFPNPVIIKDISPLYVYIQYKGNNDYALDPGPVSNKFYEYYPKQGYMNRLTGRDVSMRLLVSGLSPNSPPTFLKTSVDIPVDTAFNFDKSTIDTQDPDGDDANVSVTHLSTAEPGVSIQKVQHGYVISAPGSILGKVAQAEVQISDALDVTQGNIDLRFVSASQPLAPASADAPEEKKKEKKKGGGSFQIYWIIALLLLFTSAYFAHKHLLRKIK